LRLKSSPIEVFSTEETAVHRVEEKKGGGFMSFQELQGVCLLLF